MNELERVRPQEIRTFLFGGGGLGILVFFRVNIGGVLNEQFSDGSWIFGEQVFGPG